MGPIQDRSKNRGRVRVRNLFWFGVDTTSDLRPVSLMGRFSYPIWIIHGIEWHALFERIESTTGRYNSCGSTRAGTCTYMTHWTDDPKIHSLMTQLGKTGKTGRPTRIAYVAEQVSQIMMKVEPRVAELRAVTKDLDELVALWEKKTDLIDHRKRHIDGIKIEFEQAKQDLLSQNPDADIALFNRDLRQAIADLNDDFESAVKTIDDVKQSIRVKRSTIRGIEDRMEVYRKQVLRQMIQLRKTPRQKAA